MLTIQQIITEVDTLVPNPFDAPKKVVWLNELNREFFEIVKIPKIHKFTTNTSTSTYILPSEIKSQNIDRVLVHYTIYKSMQYENANPGHNHWIVDDNTSELVLNPKPSVAGEIGMVKYTATSKTTFLSSNLNVNPDAPEAYHWAYVLGLAERVAKAMNDVTLANNYGADYRGYLMIAQQNFGNSQSEAK